MDSLLAQRVIQHLPPRTFLGLRPEEWAALAAIVTAFATVVLAIVTFVYVRLTRRLVGASEAQLPVEFDVALTVVYTVHAEDEDSPFAGQRLGPFPELLRITNLHTKVFVHSVEFDSTRGPEPGGVIGPAEFLDPKEAPVRLGRGEVLYCDFGREGWALQSPDPEVTIIIEYSLEPDGKREAYTRRARISAERNVEWGRRRS